jgi:hypothetical protein
MVEGIMPALIAHIQRVHLPAETKAVKSRCSLVPFAEKRESRVERSHYVKTLGGTSYLVQIIRLDKNVVLLFGYLNLSEASKFLLATKMCALDAPHNPLYGRYPSFGNLVEYLLI